MAKKMGKGLVSLSSAAILSVYGIGYALTQPAAATMAAGLALTNTDASPAPSSRSTAAPNTLPATVSPSASPTASAASSTTLRDGTYSGSGMSRHGGVNVSVTVQNGRVVSAPITGVTTRYSQSVIAGLPARVVAAQSSRINLVSGATDSSMAYQQAVAQALGQAQGSSTAQSTNVTSPTGATGGSVQVTGPNGTIYSNGPTGRNRGYGQ